VTSAQEVRFAQPSAALRWTALFFAMSFPALMAWVYFVVLAGPTVTEGTANTPGFLALCVYGLSKTIQFTFPVLWSWRFERQRLQLGRPNFRGLFWGLGFGLFVDAIILGFYYGGLREALPLAGAVRAKMVSFHAETPLRYLALCLFLAGIHSLMEEYYWRWFVFRELKELMAVAPAVVLSSLAFMAHHVILLMVYLPDRFFTAALPFSLAVAVGGGVWAWLYHRTGTIYSSWLSHLLIDAGILAVGYDLLFVPPR
jgi:membrane protease YdiL (CAAX protease family)